MKYLIMKYNKWHSNMWNGYNYIMSDCDSEEFYTYSDRQLTMVGHPKWLCNHNIDSDINSSNQRLIVRHMIQVNRSNTNLAHTTEWAKGAPAASSPRIENNVHPVWKRICENNSIVLVEYHMLR